MADIINLNKFRKQKARADKKARASENIAQKGRTKQQKITDNQETASTTRLIDGHKIEGESTKTDQDEWE